MAKQSESNKMYFYLLMRFDAERTKMKYEMQ